MMFSPDEGESWPDHAIIAHDPSHRIFYWDHRPVALPNGDRAGRPAIRFRVSKDEGATWRMIPS